MKFRLFEEFTIQTNKSVASVESIMKNNVEPKLFVDTTWGPSISKDFYGIVGSDCFEIRPVTWMRNSFIPIIKDKIKDNQVDITMMPNGSVLAFTIVFIASCLIFLINSLLASPSPTVTSFAISIPIIMSVFAYCLMYFAFKYEAKRSKKILIGVLGVYYTLSI